MSELVTRSEALQLLTVSRETFRRLINAGEVPRGTKVGSKKCLRWKRSELENFLKQREAIR